MDVVFDMSAQPDGDLARCVADGSRDAPAAEAELCARFGRRVRLWAWRHLRDRHAAEDVAQKALLVMLEKLRAGAVREPDRVGAFVLGIARMVALETGRDGRREVEALPEDAGAPVMETALADPFTNTRLGGCLAALTERERSVLVLTYYGDASSTQVAASLGVTGGHVRVIRYRAIARLRTCLQEAGISRWHDAMPPEGTR